MNKIPGFYLLNNAITCTLSYHMKLNNASTFLSFHFYKNILHFLVYYTEYIHSREQYWFIVQNILYCRCLLLYHYFCYNFSKSLFSDNNQVRIYKISRNGEKCLLILKQYKFHSSMIFREVNMQITPITNLDCNNIFRV